MSKARFYSKVFFHTILTPVFLIYLLYSGINIFADKNQIALLSIVEKFNYQSLILLIVNFIFSHIIFISLIKALDLLLKYSYIDKDCRDKWFIIIFRIVCSFFIVLSLSLCLDESQFAFISGLVSFVVLLINPEIKNEKEQEILKK